jgi:hypothetical protein
MRPVLKLNRFYQFILFWFSIELGWWIKNPEFFRSFYAEDATIFGTQAFFNKFPDDLLIQHAGYMHILPRLLTRSALLFPIEVAPFVLCTLIAGVIAYICIGIFTLLERHFDNKILLVAVIFSFALVPISNFESLANAANLHFFLTAAAALFLSIKADSKFLNFQSFLICFFAATSDPFLVLLAPIAFSSGVPRSLKNLGVEYARKGAFQGWLLGVTLQLSFMAFAPGERRIIENFQPLNKVTYLFLDRVIGAAFIPNWGFVSSAVKVDNTLLVIRSLVAFTILLFLISVCYFNIKGGQISIKIVLSVAVSMTAYWVIAGVLINPEPRYAVAPGILILFFGAINIDRICRRINLNYNRNLVTYSFVILLVSTWIFSLTPSDKLHDSVGWNAQIEKVSELCQDANSTVQIVARPLKMTIINEVNHTLLLPCNN